MMCVVVLSAWACAGDGMLTGEGILSVQKVITVSDQGFNPSTLTLQVGDTLTFQWFGQNTNLHQVVVTGLPSGAVTSTNQRTVSFQVLFPTGGTFSISDNDNSGFTAMVTVIQ